MTVAVGIIDYGMGNLQSVANACSYLGAKPLILKQPEEMKELDRIILPGVGAFRQGMINLSDSGWSAALQDLTVSGRSSLLGICLGMQLMADSGTEGAGSGGATPGLGIVPGRVVRLPDHHQRVPHIGWNDIRIERPSTIFTPDLADDFYFVHSYYFETRDEADTAATCEYGARFACGVHKGKVAGIQFHPEKSQTPGLKLLKNFLEYGC